MDDRLGVISEMMVPRPYWGTSYAMSADDSRIWTERLESNAVMFTVFVLGIPTEIEKRKYSVYSGHEKSGVDRKRIIDVLTHHYPERMYKETRDVQLRYIYSEIRGEILFSSNVETARVNRLLDYHNISRFGWVSIQEKEGAGRVLINHVKITNEQFEKEKLHRLDEEHLLIERSHEIMSMMWK
jgi:hypothetical protein